MRKSFKKNLGTGLLVGLLSVSCVGTALADYSGTDFSMSLDFTPGSEYDYSDDFQLKHNDSSGLVYNFSGEGFNASMAGYGAGICEDLQMPTTYVGPYTNAVHITNYVYERGYRLAVLKGESTVDTYYNIQGVWSADSY